MQPKGNADMTVQARNLILVGAFASFTFFSSAALLHAQEVSESTEAAKGAEVAGSNEETGTAEVSENTEAAGNNDVSTSGSLRSNIQSKFEDTISGIKSGEISTAKEAAAFDDFLRRTLIRISDCWTLCKQELRLSEECARQETVQTAKEIFQKGKDAAIEQGREVILEKLPPMLGGTSEKPGEASLTDPSAAKQEEAAAHAPDQPAAAEGN